MQNSTTTRQRNARRRGFTLLEMLAVIVIIAILSSIAIPTFMGASQKAYVDAMRSDLHNLVAEQQMFFEENDEFAGGGATGNVADTDAAAQLTGAATARVLDGFQTSTDVSITMSAVTQNGWTATARHDKLGTGTEGAGADNDGFTECVLVFQASTGARINCENLQ